MRFSIDLKNVVYKSTLLNYSFYVKGTYFCTEFVVLFQKGISVEEIGPLFKENKLSPCFSLSEIRNNISHNFFP